MLPEPITAALEAFSWSFNAMTNCLSLLEWEGITARIENRPARPLNLL